MRMIVILAVLLATLLFVTGMAFAGGCIDSACYSVNGTNLTNPAGGFTQLWQICFSSTPASIGVIPPSPPLSSPVFITVFTDALNRQAVGNSPINPAGNAIYMTFHGDDFNGILSPDAIMKYRIHGYGVECPP